MFDFCIVFANLKALDLWMAGCMLSVFAALAEFVVVKVLEVQYQYQVNKMPKIPIAMVNPLKSNYFHLLLLFF